MQINGKSLNTILAEHKEWLESGGECGTRADLGGADLEGAKLQGANLEGANLHRAYLTGADLRKANLREAILVGAHLRVADLQGADLLGADLEAADLEGVNFQGADLEGAYLRGANLEGANLQGANLYKTNLQGTLLQDCTELFSFSLGRHQGYFQPSTGMLGIGCEQHLVSDWLTLGEDGKLRIESIGEKHGYSPEEIRIYTAQAYLFSTLPAGGVSVTGTPREKDT